MKFVFNIVITYYTQSILLISISVSTRFKTRLCDERQYLEIAFLNRSGIYLVR